MLSRKIPHPDPKENEHLIIELKRPTVEIGLKETTQIKQYAAAIASDERFKDTKTRWVFWAVSNKISDEVRLEINQRDRPSGLLMDNSERSLKIWVKTWGQLIDECKARLRLFQKELNYQADEDSALEYLHKVHDKYLPKIISEVKESEVPR